VEPFSHLSVLLSIILGLAITQVLQGLGRLIQARHRVRFYGRLPDRSNTAFHLVFMATSALYVAFLFSRLG